MKIGRLTIAWLRNEPWDCWRIGKDPEFCFLELGKLDILWIRK